jgi:hypothetical protein
MSVSVSVQPISDSVATANSGYVVGPGRPPIDGQFKPGQSGNPQGRPKGRLNNSTAVELVMNLKFPVRDGETVRRLPLLAANLLAQALKGAQGNARSADLALKYAEKLGYLRNGDSNTAESAANGNRSGGSVPLPAKPRPGDLMLANVSEDLLSREDMAELSRFAEIADLGGSVFALSPADFERARAIVDKGCGKDITPRDASLGQSS